MNGPPATRRDDTSYERHGDLIDDPYLWLEGDGDDVGEWVGRQNEYAADYLESVDVRESLRPAFERYARTTDYGSIVARPTGYFQEVETADDEQPILYRRDRLADDREVLVDPNEWSDDGTLSMGWWSVSPDGDLLAYGVDEGGNEQYDVTILEIDTGEILEELPGLGRVGPASFAWTPGGVYYQETGEADGAGGQLRKAISYHAFGADPASHELVYETDDPGTWPSVRTDRDGEHLVLTLVIGWERSEVFYARAGETELTPVLTDTEHMFAPIVHGDTVYVRTNHDAPFYRIASLELSGGVEEVEPDDLADVVPERDGIVVGATIADDRLVLLYERNAYAELETFDLEGEPVESIPLPGRGTVSGLSGNRDAPELFFGYQSFDHPPTVFRVDLESSKRDVVDAMEVDAGVELTVEQRWFESADGTDVPTFVVHRADLELDGDNPALLTGYGGFEISRTPAFPTYATEFLRAGGVYALANLRGGGEFGKEWHEAARHGRKQNTFDDVIAAAEFLTAEGYTNGDRLAISGGSNGGLTVGAAMTQRPELLRAVVCNVPLLDMLRFHRFLLGDSWTTEYGSPDDPEAYEWLKEYSPYHNVEEREYPAVLFKTAESDTRVHPVHAWKMAARMQELNASEHPILCKTSRDTGHGTGKPTWMIVEEQLDTWSFLFEELGVEYEP